MAFLCMRKYLKLIPIVSSLLLTACLAEQQELIDEFHLDFNYVMNIALERRKNTPLATLEGMEWLLEERNFEGEVSTEFSYILRDLPALRNVSIEEAIEDVEFLFNKLQYWYGGYIYFGGDDVFLTIKDTIIKEIEYINDSSLSSHIFSRILIDNLLPVIHDKHFTIMNIALGRNVIFYTNDEIRFGISLKGFYNKQTGQYIEEISNYDYTQLLRLFIDDYGDFFYSPFIYKIFEINESYFHRYEITIIYEDGNSEIISLVNNEIDRLLARAMRARNPLLTRIDNVPILTLESFNTSNLMPETGVAPFIEIMDYTVRTLRDEPVIIIDIRGNRGGNGLLVMQFIYSLTGEIVNPNIIGIGPLPHFGFFEIIEEALVGFTESFKTRVLELYEIYGEKLFYTRRRVPISEEQLFIFLSDRQTASAGELLIIDHFPTFKNSLIVGFNTMGVIEFSGSPHSPLPNSAIPISFGRGMMLRPERNLESIGITPDIIVMPGEDALQATISMLRRNNIIE